MRTSFRFCALVCGALGLLPGLARGQATIGDFQTPPLKTAGGTIAEQWPHVIPAIQSLGGLYQAKVTNGTEPNDVLAGMMFGLDGQSSTRKDWRIRASSGDTLLFEQNTANDTSPTWVTRVTFDSGGILTAPGPHTHPASDIVSGQFTDNRISQSSVEQYSVVNPAASRIPKSNVSAQLEAGWISQTGVTQYQGAINAGVAISASQVTSGTFADARIAASSISQYGFLLPSGAAFLWMTSTTCPTGSSEVTAFRNVTLRGADVAIANTDIPNSPNIACPGGTGCSASNGAAAYDDTLDTAEAPAHFHTQPAHVHSGPSHTHTVSGHTHSISHTHDIVIPPHTHTISLNESSPQGGSGNHVATGAQNTPFWSPVTDAGGGGTFTTGQPSTGTSGTGGAGSTSAGGTGNTGAAGDDNTSTVGGGMHHLHPFLTALLCKVN